LSAVAPAATAGSQNNCRKNAGDWQCLAKIAIHSNPLDLYALGVLVDAAYVRFVVTASRQDREEQITTKKQKKRKERFQSVT
jgi:hypothetical protein